MGKAGRPCTVCRGDHRPEIDARLKAGESSTIIGHEYDVHPSSVRRHARRHLFAVRRSAPIRRERQRLLGMIREIDLALPQRPADRLFAPGRGSRGSGGSGADKRGMNAIETTTALPHQGTPRSASLTPLLALLAVATKEALEACHEAEGLNGEGWILSTLFEIRETWRAIAQMTPDLDTFDFEASMEGFVPDASNMKVGSIPPEILAELEERVHPTPAKHCPVCAAKDPV